MVLYLHVTSFTHRYVNISQTVNLKKKSLTMLRVTQEIRTLMIHNYHL